MCHFLTLFDLYNSKRQTDYVCVVILFLKLWKQQSIVDSSRIVRSKRFSVWVLSWLKGEVLLYLHPVHWPHHSALPKSTMVNGLYNAPVMFNVPIFQLWIISQICYGIYVTHWINLTIWCNLWKNCYKMNLACKG